MSHSHDDPFDRGFAHDLAALGDQQSRMRRRAVLGLLGAGGVGLGTAGVLSWGGGAATAAAAAGASCATSEIPNETAGPYPGDGSNGPNVLVEDGVVRRDIRRSFGDADGLAQGVDFRLTLTLQATDTCTPLVGYAVYAWHCTRDGNYSLYSQGFEDENYLRGVQVTGKKGKVTFRSIYPGCYSGRWPHIHFEVYRSRSAATGGGDPVATSQVALPRKQSMHVYRNADGYESSVTNLERISLSSDNVFGDDDGVRQLATVKGSIADGYRASLLVPVDA